MPMPINSHLSIYLVQKEILFTLIMAKIIMLDLISIIWKIIGWNMYKSTKLMNFMTFFIFTLLIVTVILGLLVPILDEINTNTLADAFEIVGPYYQVIVKMLITKFSINEVCSILLTMQNHFWPADKFGANIEKEIIFIDKTVTKLFKIFIYTAYTCCSVMVIRPWLLEDSIYPLTIYNFLDKNDQKQYLFMYLWQFFNFVFGATVLLAVDGIFIIFVTNIYCQLKMLKYAFSSLNIAQIKSVAEEEKVYQKIKLYVDHHNLVLRLIKDLTKLFSLQILNQFVGNTASICMGVYIATEAGAKEFSAAIKAITIILVFLLELVLFCSGGTLITEACLEISDAMWVSKWETINNKRIRFATHMIIMRSQKREALRAGKMFEIDLTGLAAILKTAISVYTLMNNVNTKGQ